MLAKMALAMSLAVAPGAWAQARPIIATAPLPPVSFLGIWVWEIDAARAKELRLPDTSGLQVTRVTPNSPADVAGIKTGDIITEYNGQKVEGQDQFSRLVRATSAGSPVRLRIQRNGAFQVLTARVGIIPAADLPGPVIVPRNELPLAPATPDVPRSLMTWRNPALGFDAEPLFGQLASYFGVSEGVLVRSVTTGSLASKAGLRAGDVITQVGKAGVATPAEIAARLRQVNTPNVRITVMRDRAEIVLTLTLE